MAPTRAFRALRSALPWLVAAALLYWLFRLYPLEDVIVALKLADPWACLPFLLIYFCFFSVIDIWSLHLTLLDNGIRSRAEKLIRVRLATNLAMILNYGFGQGVLAYLVKRSFVDSFLRVSGVLGIVLLADLYLLVTLSFVGTWFTDAVVQGHDLAPWIRLLWLSGTISAIAILIALRWPGIAERLDRMRFGQLFHALKRAGPVELVRLALRRLPLVAAASTYLWFLALCFGIDVPIEKVIALLPLTVVVSAIPITPSGLGTAQISTIYLFEEFVSGPEIASGKVSPAEILFAMSLVFTLGIYLLKLVSGALFFRSAMEARDV